MKKIFLLIVPMLMVFSSSVFAKIVTLKYAQFPAQWEASYKVDKSEALPINPPTGMWMTREGKLSKTIEFTDKIEFRTNNPKSIMIVDTDNSVIDLTEKNGKPNWELKFSW